MQYNDTTADLNIGQFVNGNVQANTLVLNIGGEPHPIWQVESGKLAEMRELIDYTITMRRASMQRATTGPFTLALFMGGITTATMLASYLAVFSAGLAAWPLLLSTTLGMFGSAVSCTAWWNSRRRSRRAIAYLEDIQARLDAELDLRAWGMGPISR